MELTDSQKLVINTKDKSLLVSASAGSGKTFVVVERIVQSIKAGKDISSLLVLTFTNAAATELKERIVARLLDIKEEYLSAGDSENVKRIAKQILAVPASDVSTIHAFCLNIIKNNFYSLGIDPNVTTLDETKATLMLQDCIVEVVEEEYEASSDVFMEILDILGNEERLMETLNSMYQACTKVLNKDKWLEDTEKNYDINKANISDLSDTSFGKLLLEYVKNRLMVIVFEIDKMIDRLDGVDEFQSRKDMLSNIKANIEYMVGLDTYDALYKYFNNLELPKTPSNRVSDKELMKNITALKTKVSDELKSIGNILYKDTNGIIEELNSVVKYIKWYRNVLDRIDEKYNLAKKEKCAIDFSDYERLAYKVLQDENVKNKYKDKYEEIYIDEYQDTSFVQDAILSQISRGNNIIMVGDVKQSIYGFRDAKPELFSSKYNNLKEVTLDNKCEDTEAKILLSQNFRSRKEVLDSTNAVFEKLMSDKFGGAVYGDKEKLVYGNGYPEQEGDIYKTELHIIESTDDEQEDEEVDDVTNNLSKIEIEAVAVSEKIKELTNGSFNVYDNKKREYRKCEYKDIVILMESLANKVNVITNVFEEQGIPVYSDYKTGFYKSDEISIIISFLKVLNNVYDDVSLASVMYSIIGKFTLDDLLVIRKYMSKGYLIDSVYESETKVQDKVLNEKITNFIELLKRFNEYVKTFTLSDVLIKLYDETGIYMAMRFEKLGELKCANLDTFVQIIDDYQKAEGTSLYGLIKYLDILKSKESAGDSPKLLGENENVVRIMTIHKSKGLEFPVVILMNTAMTYNEKEFQEKIIMEDSLGIGLDIYNKDLHITYPSVIKQVIKMKEKNFSRSEELRLLYVAFTRAKEKLIIYGNITSLDKYLEKMLLTNGPVSEIIAFTNNSHLKCILQSGAHENMLLKINKSNEYKKKCIDCSDSNLLDRNNSSIEIFRKLVKENEVKGNKENILQIEAKQNIVYKYANDLDLEQKYTATQLKQSSEGKSLLLTELKPNVLTEKVTGAGYGTFVHSIIQKIGATPIIKFDLYKLVREQAELLKVANKININKTVVSITNLYNNYLTELINNAKLVKNELEFVIEDDLSSIPELAFTTPTLIQGVVDMYIETNDGKGIVIDFKTDKVNNKQELVDMYKSQLDIYKRAMEIVYNVKIDKTYIYSFALGVLIEV